MVHQAVAVVATAEARWGAVGSLAVGAVREAVARAAATVVATEEAAAAERDSATRAMAVWEETREAAVDAARTQRSPR